MSENRAAALCLFQLKRLWGGGVHEDLWKHGPVSHQHHHPNIGFVSVQHVVFCHSIIVRCVVSFGNQKIIPPTPSDKLCPSPQRIQEGGQL